jgi:hypothetical protein
LLTKVFDIELNLTDNEPQRTDIHVNQGDTRSVVFNFRIFDGANEIDYAGVDSAAIFFAKPDRTMVQMDAVKTVQGFSVVLSQNVLAASGAVTAGVALYGPDKERITTFFFVFWVVRDLMAEKVESTTEFDALAFAVTLLEQARRLYEEFPQLRVIGSFDTYDELVAAFPDGGGVGGGFFVDVDGEMHYFFWDLFNGKWADAGPIRGIPGAQGLPGDKGDPGLAATVEIGEVKTGEPGTDAIVENVGTASEAVLDITIPRGERGAPGTATANIDVVDSLDSTSETDALSANMGRELNEKIEKMPITEVSRVNDAGMLMGFPHSEGEAEPQLHGLLTPEIANTLRYTDPVTYIIPASELPSAAGLSDWFTVAELRQAGAHISIIGVDILLRVQQPQEFSIESYAHVKGVLINQGIANIRFEGFIEHNFYGNIPLNGIRFTNESGRSFMQVRFNIRAAQVGQSVFYEIRQRIPRVVFNSRMFDILTTPIREGSGTAIDPYAPPSGGFPRGITIGNFNVKNAVNPLEPMVWHEPVLQNGYTRPTSDFIRYSRDAMGIVFVIGRVNSGGTAIPSAGLLVFTLPVGFRPPGVSSAEFAVQNSGADTNIVIATIAINGEVILYQAPGIQQPFNGQPRNNQSLFINRVYKGAI